jgi:hypothetical protein
MSPRRPLITHRSYWLVNQMTLGDFALTIVHWMIALSQKSWPIPNIKEMFARLRNAPLRYFWCYGLNRGISPGTGQPGDAGISSFICFAEYSSSVGCRLDLNETFLFPTDDVICGLNRTSLLYMWDVPWWLYCVHGRDDQFLERLELVLIRFQEEKYS